LPDKILFPPLENFEPTRRTLHLYSQAISVVPRAHADFHPKWWHVSLKVRPDGLVTEKVRLPGGGALQIKMDLRRHRAILFKDGELYWELGLAEGLASTEFGDQIIDTVAGLGLTGEYERDRFEDDGPREYDPDAAGRFLTALVKTDRIFKEHRATLDGEVSPVQLWPHGFDLAFEWYGTRVERYEEDGQVREFPAQLNLGFYPGGKPYFYSNPWPFEADQLLDKPLPEGAGWHTEGWSGTILPYEMLVNDGKAEERLKRYARAVYEICRPTLIA